MSCVSIAAACVALSGHLHGAQGGNLITGQCRDLRGRKRRNVIGFEPGNLACIQRVQLGVAEVADLGVAETGNGLSGQYRYVAGFQCIKLVDAEGRPIARSVA